MKDQVIATNPELHAELLAYLGADNGELEIGEWVASVQLLGLDALRPALLVLRGEHYHIEADMLDGCQECAWCNLPQAWRDWAEQAPGLALGDWLTVSSAGDQAQVIAIDGDNLTLRHPGGTTSVYDIAEFDGRILTALERSTTPSDSAAPPSPSPGTETPDGP